MPQTIISGEQRQRQIAEILTKSIDPARLGKNPVKLDENAIMNLYRHILKAERD